MTESKKSAALAHEVAETLNNKEIQTVDQHKLESLIVDPCVPGQDWCVLSFVTPTNIQQKRVLNLMDHFLVESVNEYIEASVRDMSRRINAKFFKEMEDSIANLKRSKNENHQIIAQEMTTIRKKLETNEDEFATQCAHIHNLGLDDTQAKYDDFVIRRGPDVNKDFDALHGNKVSVCGIKFSGAFPFQEQAVERAKFLGENIERGVDHYVAQSFHWCPFDPNPDAIKDQRYQNKELDKLMSEKRANEDMKEKFFKERQREMIEKARKDAEDARRTNESLKNSLKKKYKEKK